jgi:hypothetical protein
MRNVLLYCLLIASFVACNTSTKKAAEPASDTIKSMVTAIDADERLAATDSAVVVFYSNPFGEDSIRYTRYYKQVAVTNILFLNLLKSSFQLRFTKLEKIKPCRSEGKLWLYNMGKVFQTVYFAYTKSGCAFLYFIKDGFMYYVDIQQPLINALEQLKPLAKQP